MEANTTTDSDDTQSDADVVHDEEDILIVKDSEENASDARPGVSNDNAAGSNSPHKSMSADSGLLSVSRRVRQCRRKRRQQRLADQPTQPESDEYMWRKSRELIDVRSGAGAASATRRRPISRDGKPIALLCSRALLFKRSLPSRSRRTIPATTMIIGRSCTQPCRTQLAHATRSVCALRPASGRYGAFSAELTLFHNANVSLPYFFPSLSG